MYAIPYSRLSSVHVTRKGTPVIYTIQTKKSPGGVERGKVLKAAHPNMMGRDITGAMAPSFAKPWFIQEFIADTEKDVARALASLASMGYRVG